MGAQPQDANKILRIGIIQGRKIIEERLIRSGQTVTIGEHDKNTFVIPPGGLNAKRHPLFIYRGGQGYYLNFTDEMDGKIAVDGGIVGLSNLKSRPNVKKRRGSNSWMLALTELNRGKVQISEITVLFQFVNAPPEPKVPVATNFHGWSWADLDTVFAGMTILSAVLHGLIVGYFSTLPVPETYTLDMLEDRFVQLSVPEEVEQDPIEIETDDELVDPNNTVAVARQNQDAGGGEGDNSEPEDSGGGPPDPPSRAEIEERVQNLGLLALIGTVGNTDNPSAVEDLLSDNSALSDDVDRALARADGLRVAQRAEDLSGLREGDGVASRQGVDGLGGSERPAGGGGQTERVQERAPTPSMSYENPDVVGNASGVEGVIRTKRRQLQSCYEQFLAQDEGLEGRVEIFWIVGDDGGVSGVEILSNTTGNAEFGSCLTRRIRRWEFPEQDGEVEVQLPFNFFKT